MPTNLFHNLNHEKKSKIITVGISEFAKYGYTNASTNRIVNHSDISKGSLFKYFDNKEDLYFYLLDYVTEELISNLGEEIKNLSKDLFQRVIEYSKLEFSWYIQHPDKYKLVINAFTKSDTAIYPKIEARYHLKDQDIFYNLLKDIDTLNFKWDKQQTIDLLKWFLQGFNEDYIRKTEVHHLINANLVRIKEDYVLKLTAYMEMLKEGLIH